MKWQVVFLRPRLEKKTAEICRRNGIAHYLPLRSQTRTYQRRNVTTEIPVFSGYLFVALDAPRKLILQKSNHVLRFLEPGRPYRMLRQLVQVRRALRVDPALRPVKLLAAGTRVRLVSGPFQGVEGVVARLAASMRVILTVEMLGQGLVVHASREQVEPLG
ncbi:MAG: transcription termination/antitermination NusG family protein [bacterium]